jgi:carboxymethylenebutenolidase
MPNLRRSRVQVPNGDLSIDAYLAMPLEPIIGENQHPAIIVIQEVFGVNEYIREVCDRIASWGYVAIAPAMFQRTAPGFEVGYSQEELALGRSHKDQMTAPQILSDLKATIAYLRQLPQVQDQSLGMIGFCFGGHVAFLGATLPEIQATALFYPSGIAVMTPGGGEPSLSLAHRIQGQVYGFFGTADPLIPNQQTDQIEASFVEQGIRHRIFRYSAGHGFACDRRADYNPEAATDAWQKVAQLFSTLETQN